MNNSSNFQFRSLFFVILLCVQIYSPLKSNQEVNDEQSINFNDIKTFIVSNKYYIGITSVSFLTLLIVYLIKKQLHNNSSKNIHELTINDIPDINKFEQLSWSEQRYLLITLIKESKNYYQSKQIYCDFITEYYKGSKGQDKMISDYNDFEKKRIELQKTDSLPEGPLQNQPLLLNFFQIYECDGVYQDIFVEYQLSKMCYELLHNKKELFAEESRDYHYVNLEAFFRTFSKIDTASDITMLFEILNNSLGPKFKLNLSNRYDSFPIIGRELSLNTNNSRFEILFIFIKLMHVTYGNDIYNCLWKDQFIQLQDTIIRYYLEYECSNFYLYTNFTIDIQEISKAIRLFLQGEYELTISVEEFSWKEIILERIIDIYRKIPQEYEMLLLKILNLIKKFHVVQDGETIVINKNTPHISTYEIFDLKTNQIVQESRFNIEYECKKLLHELFLHSAKLNSKYNLEIDTFYTEENVSEQQLINFIITLSEQCIENINNIHQETQKGIEQYSITRYGTLQKYFNENVYNKFIGEYYSQFRYLTEDNKQVFKIISQSILSPWIKVEWENSTNLPEYNAAYKPWECITFTEEKKQVYKELCDRLMPSSDLFINQLDDENELRDDLDRNINVLIYHEIQLPSNYIEKQMLQGMPFQEINS